MLRSRQAHGRHRFFFPTPPSEEGASNGKSQLLCHPRSVLVARHRQLGARRTRRAAAANIRSAHWKWLMANASAERRRRSEPNTLVIGIALREFVTRIRIRVASGANAAPAVAKLAGGRR